MNVGFGQCYGSFGEFAQGIVDGQPFLVTLPIRLESRAIFLPAADHSFLTIIPHKPKALTAVKQLFINVGTAMGGQLYIHSNIPEGKGMASSTADIVASVRAASQSISQPMSPMLISAIAASIEPTDGLMYDEICAFDHIHGRNLESFGKAPRMVIVGFDYGGQVDTLQFHQLQKQYTYEELELFKDCYALLRRGFRSRSADDIIQASTISATINQRFLPKPYLHDVYELAKRFDGGIVVAHSGTVAGVLLDERKTTNRELHQLEIEMKKITNCQPYIYYVG